MIRLLVLALVVGCGTSGDTTGAATFSNGRPIQSAVSMRLDATRDGVKTVGWTISLLTAAPGTDCMTAFRGGAVVSFDIFTNATGPDLPVLPVSSISIVASVPTAAQTATAPMATGDDHALAVELASGTLVLTDATTGGLTGSVSGIEAEGPTVMGTFDAPLCSSLLAVSSSSG